MGLYQKFPLSIYNSLSRKKETFEPFLPGKVGIYVCGPTVYNFAHLGNIRTFISFDVVSRYLRYLGYKVRYVRNITDVGHLTDDADEGEDKIAKKAKLEQLEPMEIVQKYTNDFHDTCKLFNILPPDIEPSATGHIIEQIELVQKILEAGFAYETNGSVYFDVKSYQNQSGDYGRLSGRVIEDLISNTRSLDGQEEKREPLDFALWKKADAHHIMKWPSPWGMGFPGWHLECSAMSTKYLGETFDIHGGGMDLKFPHHECEIAQNKAATGKLSCRYWMHGNMLTVNGTKMSKSLGNSFLPNELITGNHPLLQKAYSPMTVRFFMLQAHYASTLDFTNEGLEAAEKGLKRLFNALNTLKKLTPSDSPIDETLSQQVEQLLDDCFVNLSDDFNTAKCLAVLFELIPIINTLASDPKAHRPNALVFDRFKSTFVDLVENVLGLTAETETDDRKLDAAMQVLIRLRETARTQRNWTLSDTIRDELAAIGIKLKDAKEGTTYELE